MQRILEPEYMDTESEASEYDAMDHAAANDAVVARFLAIGGGSGRIIDLGTGPGDNPILVAKQRADAEILGIDAAQTMLDVAQRKVATAGLEQRIRFEQADVKALPYPEASFDGVFSNTILHHIPEPLAMLREANRILKPDGVLLIRDLYRPETEAQAWALVDTYAADATETQRKLFFDSLHASLTLEEARATANAAGLDRATVAMSSDRHYTIEVPRTDCA